MKRAFTLVELLAAMALSALLMITMLTVIASFGTDRKFAAARAATEVPNQLTDLLRWDLLNARQIRVKERSITLTGFGSLDRRTLAMESHRPVQVRYAVQYLAGRPWLVRSQQNAAGGASSSELVYAGVKDLSVIPLDVTDGPAVAPKAADLFTKTLPMTGQVWLKIAFDSPAKKPIDQVVVLR